ARPRCGRMATVRGVVRTVAGGVGFWLLIDLLRVWAPSLITIFGQAASTPPEAMGGFALAVVLAGCLPVRLVRVPALPDHVLLATALLGALACRIALQIVGGGGPRPESPSPWPGAAWPPGAGATAWCRHSPSGWPWRPPPMPPWAPGGRCGATTSGRGCCWPSRPGWSSPRWLEVPVAKGGDRRRHVGWPSRSCPATWWPASGRPTRRGRRPPWRPGAR